MESDSSPFPVAKKREHADPGENPMIEPCRGCWSVSLTVEIFVSRANFVPGRPARDRHGRGGRARLIATSTQCFIARQSARKGGHSGVVRTKMSDFSSGILSLFPLFSYTFRLRTPLFNIFFVQNSLPDLR